MGSTTFGERVRAKAYALWEADGSMEGCADEYWQKARRIVEEEIAADGSAQPAGAGRADAAQDPAERDEGPA